MALFKLILSGQDTTYRYSIGFRLIITSDAFGLRKGKKL